MTREETIELFIQNAAKVAAEAFVIGNEEEMNRKLSSIFEESTSVYCPGITEKEKAVQVPSHKRAEDYASASVCVEETFGAVAETGSLICSSSGGKPVQAGLLAPHHVAIVAAENIRETLDDFFSTVGEFPPTNITLETGPSRTADIELTLTIGVHGPERLTILIW